MISEFKIGNFKAFGPAQTIPLRPITLVFGPNSAGKSSIIQSLLLARHIHDTGNADAHQTTLGGGAVDLGGFARYTHRRLSEHETNIRLSFERSKIRKKIQGSKSFRTLAIEYTIGKSEMNNAMGSKRVIITKVALFLDEQPIFDLICNEDGLYQVDVNAIRNRLMEKHSKLESDGDLGPILSEHRSALIKELGDAKFSLHKLAFRAQNPLPRENYDIDIYASNGAVDEPEDDPHGFFTRMFKYAGDEEPKIGEIEALVCRYEFECLLEAANDAVAQALETLSYLGPLRWIPPRLIPEGEQFDASWAAGGGAAWQRLRQESELLGRVNRFLHETLHSQYRLRCQSLAPELDAETIALCVKRALESSAAASTASPDSSRVAEDASPYANAKAGTQDLATALQAELRAQTTGEGLMELSLVDAESGLAVSHRDVGTGISQLLPVLVNAAGGKNQLIAIEQPELHLHPALQAELGDVFIESALGENKNTFLIETHSEHLILRLLRRIRESNAGKQPAGSSPVRPEDIAVLFVQPTENGAVVKHLRVDKQGRLLDPWPGGFFGEAFDEMF